LPALAGAWRSPVRRRLVASLAGLALLALIPASPNTPRPQALHGTNLAASPAWLSQLNLWRASAGQSSLIENATWSAGDYDHAEYMVMTGQVTHYETAGPYYTAAGDTAAQNSNIYVSSSTATTDQQAINWWMGAPFHAMAMMDPRLSQTGFGSYRNAAASPWQMGAALDVVRGNSFTGGQFPVYFPGNLSTEPLTAYSGNEFPDPQSACPGYSGLPVFIEVGGNVSTAAGPVHTITGNGASVANCVIDSTNSSLGSYLKERGGVILMPQQHLQTGVTYTVALTVNAVPYTWSFTVGPLGTPVVPPPPGWQSLGGVLTSGPDASSWGAARVDVFARGADNGLSQDTWNGTTWTGWSSLGGIVTGDPGAVSWAPGRIDVFVRGIDGAIYHRYFDGTKWAGWESIGGSAKTGPDVASWGPQRLDIFMTGSDNQLWHKYWDGLHWGPWEPLGGILTSAPTAVSWGPNRIDIFARGQDNQMWHLAWAGNQWTGWEPMGGLFNSGPDAASCTSGHLDVFARGTDNRLWRLSLNGTQWSGWQPLGSEWISDPATVCEPGTTTLAVFEQFADSAIWTDSIPAS